MERYINIIVIFGYLFFISFVLFVLSYVPFLGIELSGYKYLTSFGFVFVVLAALILLAIFTLPLYKTNFFKSTIVYYLFWYICPLAILFGADYVLSGVTITWWIKAIIACHMMYGVVSNMSSER